MAAAGEIPNKRKATTRRERLAEALRANLRRRKEQERRRAAPAARKDEKAR